MAQSPVAPTNDPRIKNYSPFFLLGSLTPTHEKRWGGLGHLPKIALLREKDFDLKSFVREVVEGKKMIFHTFL